MNSELLKTISESLKKLEAEKRAISKEMKTLKSSEDLLSRKGKVRLWELSSRLDEVVAEIKATKNDYEDYLLLVEEIKKLESLVMAETKPETKEILTNLLGEKNELKDRVENNLEEYYHVEQPEETATEESKEQNEPRKESKGSQENKTPKKSKSSQGKEPQKPEKRKHTVRNILIGAAGISLVVSVAGMFRGCGKDSKNDDPVAITEFYDAEDNNEYDELELEETYDVNTFDDITDQDKLGTRAAMLIEDLNTNNPNHDFTIEEIENIMKWINGGVPTEIGQEEALYAISRIEVLMNRENQREVDRVFDISKLFLDGSQGQKLAAKIYNSREKMLDTLGKPEFETYAQEFGVLLAESWYLTGANDEISAWSLETSGMEALIDKYFLNTITIAQSGKDTSLIVNVPNYGEFSLEQINKEINEPTCPTIVTADNGETFETTMNKFSSDMIGMVTEATLNKQNNFTLAIVDNN